MQKGDTARALEDVKESLQNQLEQAVRSHVEQQGGTLELDVDLRPGDHVHRGDSGLVDRVQDLVHAFHNHPIVRQTGVEVHKVTAWDADGDGQGAVNVKYEYAV